MCLFHFPAKRTVLKMLFKTDYEVPRCFLISSVIIASKHQCLIP